MTVGSQDAATTWHLPKALLIHQSPFFVAALNGSFAEAKLDSVTMPEDDPNVFRLWVQWLFAGTITRHNSNGLVKAWILGDKLGCPIFQNTIMMALLECRDPKREDRLVEPSALRAAYEGSTTGSKLRKWALDFFLFETRKIQDGSLSAAQRNLSWISETKDIEDLSQDYMEARVGCSQEGAPANPFLNATQYMESLDSTAP